MAGLMSDGLGAWDESNDGKFYWTGGAGFVWGRLSKSDSTCIKQFLKQSNCIRGNLKGT